ncbi:CDP-alcohol phosphatidyltransferase-like enzyme [Sphingobacterium sp. JUb20]|nr:CDP-alcohol phosphatidyltransferase-like enzyme [Sphingobacterium sp. JUb20]
MIGIMSKSEHTLFEQSLKSNDTEERIDIWFYRPIGYRIAKFCARIGVTPNAVTITSIFFGVGAGILFYYGDLWINIIGMLLLVFANSLDSADGQLARMTDNKSRFGRILDGFAGDFWFAAIHIALCLRCMNEGWSAWIWVPGVLAGVSHVFQSAMADYYRNVHLYFIKGKAGSELDNSKELQAELDKMSWKKDFFQKFVLNGYKNYTTMQENFSPKLQQLLQMVKNKYADQMPASFVNAFRIRNRPLMKYTNIVQFNTRVLFLFLWIFIDQVWLYFFFDMFILNPILIYMCKRQEQVSAHFIDQLATNQYDEKHI